MLLPLIHIDQADISYNNLLIFNNINLVINKGEHWVFTGKSGSGKTLLLEAIAGNIPLRQGKIIRYFSHTGNFKHNIAYVAAKHSFRNLANTSGFYYQQRYNSSDSSDVLTVKAYLEGLATAELPYKYWTIDNTINLLQLAGLADKEIIKLSNGETKRLVIAAALIKNPLLLILDNPLAGLDAATRAYFNDILKAIIASGITIIMASGVLEIPEVITHVGIIKNNFVHVITHDNFKDVDNLTGYHSRANFNFSNLLNGYPSPVYEHIVNMQNVNVRYGEKQVLSTINWKIQQAERWALLGPNGAGKSTLLSLINGDNPQAYANDITLFDRMRGSGESIWDIKKKTGFVSPELHQYFPADTLCLHAVESGYYDTIGLFRPSDTAKAAIALLWLKVLDIDKYARQPLRNVPAGTQRLCLLARAMIKCPILLILDEPCQGLDDQQILNFKYIVDTICKETNVTLIYVTHYAEHIPNSVIKTLRLSNGTIVNECTGYMNY